MYKTPNKIKYVCTVYVCMLQGYQSPSLPPPQALSLPVPIYVHVCREGIACRRVKCLGQQHNALALARAGILMLNLWARALK